METKENINNQNTDESNKHKEGQNENEISESEEKTSKSNENTLNSKKYMFTRISVKVYLYFIICIAVVLTAVFVESYSRHISKPVSNKPKYWAYSNQGGDYLLKHVHNVLKRIGFEEVPENSTNWDLLWSREFPFMPPLSSYIENLEEHQRVNHVPGISNLCHKGQFSMIQSKYIPRSFALPKEKEILLDYAKNNKNVLFLQKSVTHRGIMLKDAADMDLSGESFAQVFVQNPLLIDGYMFDIGIYMVLTAVNPLRIYWYQEDVLLRFCPQKYHPFDPSNLDQYIIRDDYKPSWEIPSLAYSLNGLKSGMKGALDSYLRTLNIDPAILWNNITEAITDLYLMKEHNIIESLDGNTHQNFFEMTRVDIMLDEDFNVHVIEVNFSPNLLADDKPTNQVLYEQLLYNTFRITGIASLYEHKGFMKPVLPMISEKNNIVTWGNECVSSCVPKCDSKVFCELCLFCRSASLTATLQATHTENLNKGAFRRLFPPRLKPGTAAEDLMPSIENLTTYNQLLYLWYQGKCNDDVTWCN